MQNNHLFLSLSLSIYIYIYSNNINNFTQVTCSNKNLRGTTHLEQQKKYTRKISRAFSETNSLRNLVKRRKTVYRKCYT